MRNRTTAAPLPRAGLNSGRSRPGACGRAHSCYHHVEITFWICALLVAYTYVLYPISIALYARVRTSRTREDTSELHFDTPFVSVILCARDELARITDRLDNLCRQDYDPAKLEVIVVSDGSTDGTADAIRAFTQGRTPPERPTITLIEKSASEGKPAGLNDAVARSRGDILVMADARQQFGYADHDTGTVRNLVNALLHDPAVGCVSGELIFLDGDRGNLEADLGAYWRYEKWIRRNESAVDSVPGVTGAVYAIRRELFEPIPPCTLLDDVLIPLRVILRGHRVIFDGRAVARDRASSRPKQEWQRKVRTLAGNWQLLHLIPGAFNPMKNRIWVQFISHKILRLVVPFALLLAFAVSALVPPLQALFALQLAFYVCAALGAIFPAVRKVRLLALSHTFVLLNLAALAGFWSWITGRSGRTWKRPTVDRA